MAYLLYSSLAEFKCCLHGQSFCSSCPTDNLQVYLSEHLIFAVVSIFLPCPVFAYICTGKVLLTELCHSIVGHNISSFHFLFFHDIPSACMICPYTDPSMVNFLSLKKCSVSHTCLSMHKLSIDLAHPGTLSNIHTWRIWSCCTSFLSKPLIY